VSAEPGDSVNVTLLIFFLVTGIPAGFQFKQRHDLEERATSTAHTRHNIYVLTPNQRLRIVYANSWKALRVYLNLPTDNTEIEY
jgi:hypothetical protein